MLLRVGCMRISLQTPNFSHTRNLIPCGYQIPREINKVFILFRLLFPYSLSFNLDSGSQSVLHKSVFIKENTCTHANFSKLAVSGPWPLYSQ